MIIVIILLAIPIIAILTFIFTFLWNNALVPALTIANPIDFWTGLGLLILFAMIFGRFYESKNS